MIEAEKSPCFDMRIPSADYYLVHHLIVAVFDFGFAGALNECVLRVFVEPVDILRQVFAVA